MRYYLILLINLIFAQVSFAANLTIDSDFSIVKSPLNLSSLKTGSVPSAVNRIFCPPLLRFNGITSRFEPIGLLTAPVVDASKSQTVWRFRFRQGVKWWDGSIVSIDQLQEFFRKNLSQALQQNLGSNVDVPDFTVNNSGGVVEVSWVKPPAFGPYAIADFPFYRELRPAGAYECIGFFKSESASKRSFVSLGRGTAKIQEVSFENPHSANHLQLNISSKDKCSGQTETSVFTAVLWNQSRFPFDQSNFRKALTAGIPRGEILRSVFMGLGDLISLPSSRRWGAYDSNLKVRPYDSKAVGQALTALGFKREMKDGFFRDQSNQELVLNLYVPSKSNGVLEKMITDAYSESGLRVKTKSELKGVDGALIAMQFGDSSLDTARMFLKGSALDQEFAFNFGAKIRAAAGSYLVAASRNQISNDRSLHKVFYEEEPISVMIQHHACIQKAANLPNIDLMNPDWLRSLVQ